MKNEEYRMSRPIFPSILQKRKKNSSFILFFVQLLFFRYTLADLLDRFKIRPYTLLFFYGFSRKLLCR